MRRGTLVTVSSIHTARGGAIVLSLQRCTMRCQIELCAGVIYLIRGQDTQIIELGKRMFANVSQSWTLPGGAFSWLKPSTSTFTFKTLVGSSP